MSITVKPGYCSQAADKTVAADLLEFALLRQLPPGARLMKTASLNRSAKLLCLSGVKRRHPSATFQEQWRRFAIAVSGRTPEFALRGDEMTWIQDSIGLACKLHLALEGYGFQYYVTGGVAATAHGEFRTTRDLDVVVKIQAADIGRLVELLQSLGFYCPDGAIDDIQSGRSRVLSVTHMESVDNADFVLNADTEFDQMKMQRRQKVEVPSMGEFYVASPEDVILAKLLWRQKSRSEQQWRDVLGVLKVQGDALDFHYLIQWGEHLEIAEDLAAAMEQSGL